MAAASPAGLCVLEDPRGRSSLLTTEPYGLAAPFGADADTTAVESHVCLSPAPRTTVNS